MPFGESDYSEYSTNDQQLVLYEQIGFGEPGGDIQLHDLFYDYYYNDDLSLAQRVQIYDELVERIETVYGIEFDEVWDWEDFRTWYESA